MNAIAAIDTTPQSMPDESAAILSKRRDGGCVAPLVWHVARIYPQQLDLARGELHDAGYVTLSPMVRETRPMPRGKTASVLVSLWPGYLPIGRTPDQPWADVYRCRGCAGLVHVTGDRYTPADLPASVADWLMRHMSKAGVIEALSSPGPQATKRKQQWHSLASLSSSERVAALLGLVGQ
jgi:hypothetical protein